MPYRLPVEALLKTSGGLFTTVGHSHREHSFCIHWTEKLVGWLAYAITLQVAFCQCLILRIS